MKLQLLFFLLLFLQRTPTLAQIPERSKPLPEFTLAGVKNFKTDRITNTDFAGRWLVLDFWSINCLACIQSMPKVNALSQSFRNDIDWIMVGNENSKNPGIKDLYERAKAKWNLEMPYTYDSILAEKWNVKTVPHIVIVDPNGIVYSVTSGVSEDKLRDLISGKPVNFKIKDQTMGSIESTLDENSTSKGKILSKSWISEWGGEKLRSGASFDRWITWPQEYLERGYRLSMVSLSTLYKFAYFGNDNWYPGNPLNDIAYPHPILELRDTSQFFSDFNSVPVMGTYNYFLQLPIRNISKESMMVAMQEDLKSAFGYVAKIESRKMKVWKLVAQKNAAEILKTKGEKKYVTRGPLCFGGELRNIPVSILASVILDFFPSRRIVVIDKTGIDYNIDITLRGDLTEFENLRATLRESGLDLIQSTESLDVLVIRDPSRK